MASSDLLASKMQTLIRQNLQLRQGIALCQTGEVSHIQQALCALETQRQADSERLAASAAGSALSAAAHLAQAQMNYLTESAAILAELTADNPCAASLQEQDQGTQTLILYAEYAIDYAALAMHHALTAALSAAAYDGQLTPKETTP